MRSVEARMRAALSRVDPPICVVGEMRRVSGYVNDVWFFDSSAGQVVAKVRNIPEEDPEQIQTYVGTMDLLQRIGFPTPRLLVFERSCEDLDGCQLSVLERARGLVASDVLARPTAHRWLPGSLGRTVGRLHSIALPMDTVWRDDCGVEHGTWTGVVLSSLAEAEAELDGRVGEKAAIVEEAVARIRDRANEALAAVAVPRLVHRDLHLGNFLVDREAVSALLDFEMVRDWDPTYDFVKISNSIYPSHPQAEERFMAAYREQADTSYGFSERVSLYQGLHHLLSVVEFLDGNDAYRNSLGDLQRWLVC